MCAVGYLSMLGRLITLKVCEGKTYKYTLMTGAISQAS